MTSSHSIGRAMSIAKLCFILFALFSAKTLAKKTSTQQYTYTLVKSAPGCPTRTPLASTVYHLPLATSTGTATASNAPSFTGFAASNGQVLPQMLAYQGSTTAPYALFHMANTSRIEMLLSNGHSAVVDNTGVTLYNSSCLQALHLPISNLATVLSSSSTTSSATQKTKRKPVQLHARDSGAALDIKVQYLDQCSNPIDGHQVDVQCITGIPASEGAFQYVGKGTLQGTGNGYYAGSCGHPDATASYNRCVASMKNILDYPTTGFLGQLTNLQGDLHVLGKLIGNGVIADGIAAVAGAFALPEVATAVGILGVYQGFVAAGGDDLIATHYCKDATQQTIDVEAEMDVQPSFVQINTQTSLPFTAVAATKTVSLSSITSCSSSTSTGPTQPTGTNLIPDPLFAEQKWKLSSSGASYEAGEAYQGNTFLRLTGNGNATIKSTAKIHANTNYNMSVAIRPLYLTEYCTLIYYMGVEGNWGSQDIEIQPASVGKWIFTNLNLGAWGNPTNPFVVILEMDNSNIHIGGRDTSAAKPCTMDVNDVGLYAV